MLCAHAKRLKRKFGGTLCRPLVNKSYYYGDVRICVLRTSPTVLSGFLRLYHNL